MDFKIRYNLWKAKDQLKPDAKFKADLWSKLDARLHVETNTSHSWFETRQFKLAAALAVTILVVGTAGTGAYAYTSPDVTTGTPLYPIKQQLEKVEEKVQITPEAKANFYLKQIKRREAEAVVIQKRAQKTDQVEIQIQKTEDQIKQAETNLEKIQSKNPGLRTKIKGVMEKGIENRKFKLQNRLDNLQSVQKRLEQTTSTINLN